MQALPPGLKPRPFKAEDLSVKDEAPAFQGGFTNQLESLPVRARSMATVLSAFQKRRLGFLRPHWT